MEATLDRFGRVLIPKGVRRQLGMTAGQTFEIKVGADEIVLKPHHPEAGLAVRDGVLIYRGGKLETDVGDMVKTDREQRDAKNMGIRS